jgi:UDP-N-acetyl-D-mannosaminuronate dehydrogenase
MNELRRTLQKRIKDKKAVVGVVGLGYVGLPLVKAFLKKGFAVTGFDIDRRKVDMLNRGRAISSTSRRRSYGRSFRRSGSRRRPSLPA